MAANVDRSHCLGRVRNSAILYEPSGTAAGGSSAPIVGCLGGNRSMDQPARPPAARAPRSGRARFFAPAPPLLLVWVPAAEIEVWTGRPGPPPQERLGADERAFLRRLARRTWLYFETF